MLKKILRFFGLVVGLICFALCAEAQEPALAITHVNLIDATGSPATADMTVIIGGKQISQIGKSDAIPLPKGARVVDGRGKYLIPGLWDMHVHEVFGEWIPADEKITPVLFVANGVTGVRDMGGDL
jgi:imidazolonepropionase-like amidohydrolase